MKVKKNKRVLVNICRSISTSDAIICKIVRSGVRAQMLQFDQVLKEKGEFFKVLLIGETIPFDPIVTPLQASLAPPLQTGEALFVATEGDPADVVAARF